MIAMKRFINIAVFCLVGWLLLSGCYDDKGSYDYQDINELIIDLPTIGGCLCEDRPQMVSNFGGE